MSGKQILSLISKGLNGSRRMRGPSSCAGSSCQQLTVQPMQLSTHQQVDGSIYAFACEAASTEHQEQRPQLSVFQPTRYISQPGLMPQQSLTGDVPVHLWTYLRLGVCEHEPNLPAVTCCCCCCRWLAQADWTSSAHLVDPSTYYKAI